jgi:hypothetical protein
VTARARGFSVSSQIIGDHAKSIAAKIFGHVGVSTTMFAQSMNQTYQTSHFSIWSPLLGKKVKSIA